MWWCWPHAPIRSWGLHKKDSLHLIFLVVIGIVGETIPRCDMILLQLQSLDCFVDYWWSCSGSFTLKGMCNRYCNLQWIFCWLSPILHSTIVAVDKPSSALAFSTATAVTGGKSRLIGTNRKGNLYTLPKTNNWRLKTGRFQSSTFRCKLAFLRFREG